MRVNFGCGRRVLDGWFNVDAVLSPRAPRAPELLHAVTFKRDGAIANPLPLADGCADELQALHVVEHVCAWEAPALVGEWRRLLKSGGQLILELPDIEKAAQNLLRGRGDQWCMWPFYGDPSHRDPWMTHRWGYTPVTIMDLVAECGFVEIKVLPPQTHGPRPDRDMRVEARKP